MRKIISNELEANLTNNDHHPKRAATIAPLKAALIAPVAASTDLAVEVAPAIWTVRLRTDRVAIFRASGSRTFNAAPTAALGVTGLAVVIDSVVAAADLEVIALVEVALAEAALADSAVEGGADGNN